MGIRITILLITLFFIPSITNGEIDSVSAAQKKIGLEPLRIGLNYHLQISQLDFSPIVFLKTKRRVEPGFGLNYLYYYRNSRKGKSSVGFNLFTRYFVSKNIFAHAEYLYCDVPYLQELNNTYRRVKKADFFIGGGYKQHITDSVEGYLFLLININHTSESAYKNLLLFKVGISF